MAHDHHHHHHDDRELAVIEEPLDPGSQSLSDALRASFRVLQLIMLVVFVLYLLSGFTMVDQKEELVLFRFGKARTLANGEWAPPLKPGLRFAFPYPIDEKVKVMTAQQTLELGDFWLVLTEREQLMELSQLSARGNKLDPAREGALLTGDRAIWHLNCIVNYSITDANRYVQNVSDERSTLESVIKNALVAEAARTPAETIWKRSQEMLAAAMPRAQEALDRIGSGITIISMTGNKSHYPLQVKDAVLDVSKAETRRTELIQDANKEWQETLKGAAGNAWAPLHEEIKKLDTIDSGPEYDTVFNRISELLTEEAAGQVATRIREAEAGRDQILDETRGLVTRYKSWLEQYKRSPDLVKARLRQEMIADLFDTEDESIPTIWIVDDKSGSYLFLGPDPAAIQRRWQQDMKRKSEQK